MLGKGRTRPNPAANGVQISHSAVCEMTVEDTNSHIAISGDIPGRAYRVTLFFRQDTPSW